MYKTPSKGFSWAAAKMPAYFERRHTLTFLPKSALLKRTPVNTINSHPELFLCSLYASPRTNATRTCPPMPNASPHSQWTRWNANHASAPKRSTNPLTDRFWCKQKNSQTQPPTPPPPHPHSSTCRGDQLLPCFSSSLSSHTQCHHEHSEDASQTLCLPLPLAHPLDQAIAVSTSQTTTTLPLSPLSLPPAWPWGWRQRPSTTLIPGHYTRTPHHTTPSLLQCPHLQPPSVHREASHTNCHDRHSSNWEASVRNQQYAQTHTEVHQTLFRLISQIKRPKRP